VAELIVGISMLEVSADPSATLVTYALGSCLGITIYDPVARVGGLLHAMLPTSKIDPEKASRQPSAYVDTGVPLLFRACYAAGAVKARLIVKVAGCASLAKPGEADNFQIGKRNMVTLRQLLWKNGVLIAAEDVGGFKSRTMILMISDGTVSLKSPGETATL
jgi:chemotaxis protein CheD